MPLRDAPQDPQARPDSLPQPHGWFEVFCCMAILLAFGAVLLFFGLYH